MIKKLRLYFVTGLVVLTPLGITILLFIEVFKWVDGLLLEYFQMLRPLGINLHWLEDPITGLGAVIVVLGILMTGMLARNIIGRQVLAFGESILNAIPLFNRIYNGLRQIIDVFAASQQGIFRKAVMIEYPRRGMYSIGFHTSDPSPRMAAAMGGQELMNIFLPTTPNPTSGFLLLVPRADVLELDITIEEALKLIISGGAVSPETARNSKPAGRRAARELPRTETA